MRIEKERVTTAIEVLESYALTLTRRNDPARFTLKPDMPQNLERAAMQLRYACDDEGVIDTDKPNPSFRLDG